MSPLRKSLEGLSEADARAVLKSFSKAKNPKEWACVYNYLRREKKRVSSQKWYAGNRAHALSTMARWRKLNPEKVRQSSREWYAAHRELQLTRRKLRDRAAGGRSLTVAKRLYPEGKDTHHKLEKLRAAV